MAQEITFAMNAAALAVATIIVRHPWTVDDIGRQYSALELTVEANSRSFSDCIRIHDVAILQQGLFEFKNVLKKNYLNLDLISMKRKNVILTPAFGCLQSHLAAFDVIFRSGYTNGEIVDSHSVPLSQAQVISRIEECANKLLTMYYKHPTNLSYSCEQVKQLYHEMFHSPPLIIGRIGLIYKVPRKKSIILKLNVK